MCIYYEILALNLYQEKFAFKRFEIERMLLKYLCINMIFIVDVPDYEVEVSEHFDSVHIEGDEPADEYSLHDQQQQVEPVVEFVKETPVEDSSALNNVVDHEQEPLPSVEESIGEPKKFTYASIVCISAITTTSHQCDFICMCLHS